MLYFVVNNNYQYLEAARLAAELKGTPCRLIAFPHTLVLPADQQVFESVIVLDTPARQSWLKAWRDYLGIGGRLRKLLAPAPDDVLVLFTEFELLNQLTAIHFKRADARVYLIEDGGVGSYIPLALDRPEAFSLKDRIYGWMIRAIPGLWQTHFTKFDGIVCPLLADRFFDGVLLYRKVAIRRDIPVMLVDRPATSRVEVAAGRVVFLNQPFYSEHIQSPEVYADGLRKIMTALCEGFSEVFFKFHPREPQEARDAIVRDILSAFPLVNVVEGNGPFEAMIAQLRPEAVASYNSTPLFNLVATGIQPMFVYSLLPELRDLPSFRTMHALLEAWHYQFPSSWAELRAGFSAGAGFNSAASGQSLSEVLCTAS
jgi:hypothetical protein